MRILFTGASSFSGYWFVRELAQAGHEVVCPLRGAPESYTGPRRRRSEALQSVTKVRLLPGVRFGEPAFLDLARQGPWDLLCHHGAEVGNYKAPDFDVLRALESNTHNLRPVLETLQSGGVTGVILTGTVFERGEGLGEEPLRAFSPYGLSKTLTWEAFHYACTSAGLPLGKFVISNPFGPLEEPRFTAYLARTWREGKAAIVQTPDYVRDNIPVDLLARVYVGFAQALAAQRPAVSRRNPAGYAGTVGQFAERVAREFRARLGWACEVQLALQQDFSEPLRRVNSEPAAAAVPDWKEAVFWDAFAAYHAHPES